MALLGFTTATAQNASQLLEQVKQSYTHANGLEASYTLTMLDASGYELGDLAGTIQIDGNCFALCTDGIAVWYDGTDMWSLLEGSDEVNVTVPDETELQDVNPFFLLNNYEQSYTATLDSDGRVVLTPLSTQSSVASIVLGIDAKEKLPTSILWRGSDGNTLDIVVSSYKRNQLYAPSVFTFDRVLHPDVEVIDLR